jgi:protein transport protein SEC31
MSVRVCLLNSVQSILTRFLLLSLHHFYSSGKDNRTILWDLCTLQPIADIPNDPVDNHQSDVQHSNSDLNSSASNIYSAAAAQQKRYHVQWSPLKRGVIATCSLDRKVQAHTVNGLVTKCGRPPKWLRPNSGVSCGFGGTVLAFSTSDKVIKLSTVVEETKLVKASALLEAAATTETTEFCAQMAAASILPGEKEIWAFMQVIFQANARSQLLEHLGFHPEVIQTAATEFTESEKDAAAAGVASMSLKDKAGSMSPAAEKAVQDALVVGNFEAAVECCFRTGNLADALILASCGGADLWAKTQARYFASEGPKKAFLAVVNAVISEQLDTLVEKSTNWQETLAIVSTYAKSEAFPSLCIKLGEKLEAAGDSRNASLCFMCSLSLERAVKYWKSQLDRKGSSNLLALHDFCRKVSIFMRANPNVVLEPEIAAMFDKYATVLSEQGLLVTAAKYVKVSPELKDRLYRSSESPNCLAAMGNRPPDFPFAMVVVNKAPAARPQQQQQGYGHQQQQHQQQSAYGRQPQQSAYGQQQPRAAAYGQQQPQQAAFSQQQQPSSMAQQPTVHKPQPAPIAQQVR